MSDDFDSWTKEQLAAALVHRTEIGKALGILMERFGMTDEQAVAYLKRCSQESNRKLYDVADELARTRDLPLPPEPETA